MPGSRFLRRSEVHTNSPASIVSELNLILLGPPGAGKGTQAERLQEDFDLAYIATGDILRKAVAEGTDLGQKAKQYMDNGDLVPDEVVPPPLPARRMCTKNGHVYNVYPDPPKHDEVCDQDGSRLVQRDDDREQTVRKRLEVYHRQTSPLVKFYEERDLLKRFDGSRSPTEVHDHSRATIATLRLEDEL